MAEATSYPFHVVEPLLCGDYDLFDLWDLWDEEAFGIAAEAFDVMQRDAHLGVIS